MYHIKSDAELDTRQLSKILQHFQGTEKPRLQKYYDYNNGLQAILSKRYTDPTKVCNHIVKNYCNNIVENYKGYIVGQPVNYTCDRDISSLMDVFQYNDIENADAELLENALIFGVAYEIAYIDEDAKQRFKTIDSRECVPVYDDTLNENLLYMIRYFAIDDNNKYRVEVYGQNKVSYYEANSGLGTFVLLEEKPHYFHQVPFVEFRLNREKKSIFANVMSLQDAYNELLSSEIDDFEAFVDAFLVLKGTGVDEDSAELMRQNRILIMDAEDSAEYLTKNINDTQIENMLTNLNDSIHKIANSPDFNDEKFMAQSGVALRYKLVGFENAASAIVAAMTKALQKRIELLYEVMGLVNGDDFADVQITFTRNLPVDTMETVNLINSLRGVVSDETLLSLLPFVQDPAAELEKVSAEKAANVELYSFGEDGNEF